MNVLITAGNTQTPIDQVRCITNIFTGKTGARIALEAVQRGHRVTLFTSHPEVLSKLIDGIHLTSQLMHVTAYRTFHDLSALMENTIPNGNFDVIIHAAAVSDYTLAGIFAETEDGAMLDVSAGKVKSHHPELWMRMVPTPKLVDRIRPWGFTGILVKFKLEVGLSDQELLAVAERARVQSGADLIVANTLEGKNDYAFIGPIDGKYERVSRDQLAQRLLDLLEPLAA